MIDGGDLTLELFPAPGHTDDHLAIAIPAIGTLLAGDAAEDPFPFASTPGGLVQLRATLRALAALRPRTALYCHAPGRRDAALIERNIAYFESVEAHCREALAHHRTRDGVDVGREVLARWPLAEAIGTETMPTLLATMYEEGYRQHVASMLHLLQRDKML